MSDMKLKDYERLCRRIEKLLREHGFVQPHAEAIRRGLNTRTVATAVQEGRIPSVPLGFNRLVPVGAFDAAVSEGKLVPAGRGKYLRKWAKKPVPSTTQTSESAPN